MRATAHLLALITICSFLIGVCRFFPFESETSRIMTELSSRLGSLKVAEDGVSFEKAPAGHEAFIINPSFRFDCFSSENVDLKDMDTWKSPSGVILSKKMLLGWVRQSERYTVFPMPFFVDELPSVKNGSLNKEQVETLLKECAAAKQKAEKPSAFMELAKLTLPNGKLNLKEIAFPLALAITLVFASINFAGIIFFSFMIVLFFAGAQHIWVSGSMPKMRFANTYTISVYASFPALLIASLIPAFALPLISFQTMFLIVFFIYHLMAFNKIQKFLAPPKEQTPSSWDDED